MLDALLPAAHRERAGLPRPARRRADRRRRPRPGAVARGAAPGVDAVCHQAAMVGLGVDVADVARLRRHNDLGTAVLLAAMAARGSSAGWCWPSSMVVYGEGRYELRRARRRAARPAPPAPTSTPGRFEPPCPLCGRAAEPGRGPRGRAARPAQRLRRDQARAGAPGAASGRARPAGGVGALRYHNVYGPRMPRDTPYAGVASHLPLRAGAAASAPRVFEDGGQRRDFVHVTRRRRGQPAARCRPAAGAGCAPYNVASGEPHTVGRHGARRWRDALRRPGARWSPASTGSATSGTSSPPGAGGRASSASGRAVDVRRRHARVRHRPPPGSGRHRNRKGRPPRSGSCSTGGRRDRVALPGRGRRTAVGVRGTAPGLAGARRRQRLDRRHGRGSQAWAPGWWASPAAATGRPCTPGCGDARADLVAVLDGDGSLDAATCRPRRRGARGPSRPRGRPPRPDRSRGVAVARPRRERAGRRAAAEPGRAGARHRPDPGRAQGGPARPGVADRAFGYPLELLLRAGRAGWRIEELPVRYARRAGGRSKVSGSVTGTARAVRDMGALLLTRR